MLSWDNVRRLPPRCPLLLSVMCIWFQSDSKSRRFDYYYHYYYWRKAAGKEWLWRIASFFFFLPGTVGRRKQEQHCQVMVTAWAFDQRISVWHVVAIGWCAAGVTGWDPCIQQQWGKALLHLLLSALRSGCTLAVQWSMNTLRPSHLFINLFI